MYCELGRYKNALICIQAVASFHRNAQFFFLFLSFLLFSMHVHVLFSRATTCAITYHRARWNVHEYSHMRRLHACPFERVRGSWNSMGTCAYGDGRVTCLPSGPCKHETTLGVETPRETIAIFAYFTRLTLYIYIYIQRMLHAFRDPPIEHPLRGQPALLYHPANREKRNETCEKNTIH